MARISSLLITLTWYTHWVMKQIKVHAQRRTAFDCQPCSTNSSGTLPASPTPTTRSWCFLTVIRWDTLSMPTLFPPGTRRFCRQPSISVEAACLTIWNPALHSHRRWTDKLRVTARRPQQKPCRAPWLRCPAATWFGTVHTLE